MAANKRRTAIRFTNGVRLSPPTASRAYWRARVPDASRPQGYREESLGTDETAARDRAAEIDGTLVSKTRARLAERLDRPYSELLDEWLDPKHHPSWSNNNASEIAGIVNKWVVPTIGHVRCGDIDGNAYMAVFAKLRLADRHGSLDRMRAVLSNAHSYGTRNRWLEPGPFPVTAVEVTGRKVTKSGAEEGYIPEGMRPDEPRVRRLIEALETVGWGGTWWRGLQGQVAAYPGLRLGETFALRCCHIDGQLISVNWQYIEQSTSFTSGQLAQMKAAPDELLWLSEEAAIWPTQPGVLLKRPKSEKVRVAVAPPWLVERLERRVAEASGQAAPPCPDCSDADCALLFPSPAGAIHSRSLFGRDVARKAFKRTHDDEDTQLHWPVKRRGGWQWHWHHLRHRSAGHHLDRLRLPVSDAATLLGHTEKTLMTRYYGSDQGVLERAIAAYDSGA